MSWTLCPLWLSSTSSHQIYLLTCAKIFRNWMLSEKLKQAKMKIAKGFTTLLVYSIKMITREMTSNSLSSSFFPFFICNRTFISMSKSASISRNAQQIIKDIELGNTPCNVKGSWTLLNSITNMSKLLPQT